MKKPTHEQVALAFVRKCYAYNDRLTANDAGLWLRSAGAIGAHAPDGLVIIAEWPGRSASIVKTSARRAVYHAAKYAVVRFDGLYALPATPAKLLDAWNAVVAERAALGLPPFIFNGQPDAVVRALNDGENRYRQTVLGQEPVPGLPVIVKPRQRPATARTPASPSPDLRRNSDRAGAPARAPERARENGDVLVFGDSWATVVKYHDGGRAEAGFTGTTGDCVTRAVAIGTGLPYRTVYNAITAAGNDAGTRSAARLGVPKKTTRAFLASLGWRWVPVMKIGSGCTMHLRGDELPPGRLIVKCSRHIVAVVDGVVFDTYDSTRAGTRCVYGYWVQR